MKNLKDHFNKMLSFINCRRSKLLRCSDCGPVSFGHKSPPANSHGNLLALLTLMLLSVFCLPARIVLAQEPPQDDVPLAPNVTPSRELYRLRVENAAYGSVSLSADGGLHYTLIGRVTHPATAVAVERAANLPGVILRSGGDGLAFAVNLGQTLKLRPAALPVANGKHAWPAAASPAMENSAILTNLTPRTGLFGELALSRGTTVKMEVNERMLGPFPTLYEPSSEDVYIFVVPRIVEKPAGADTGVSETKKNETGKSEAETLLSVSLLSPEAVKERIQALGQAYAAQSLARALQEHRTLFSGTLTLKAKLPAGEPDPIAYVTYAIDNHLVSVQNVAPFDYEWDTRQAVDGEHVIEIRALNRNRHVITSQRKLVIVQNKPN